MRVSPDGGSAASPRWSAARLAALALAAGALLTAQVSEAFDVAWTLGALVAAGAWLLLACGIAAPRVPGRWRNPVGVGAVAVALVAIAGLPSPATPDGASHPATSGRASRHGNVIALTGDTPCERSGPPAFRDQHGGGHGDRGPVPWRRLDRTTRTELATQVTAARAAAARYPTVADAVAGGYRQVTRRLPCIGAHYIHDQHVLGDGFDPAAPEMLLYDGTAPGARIVGLSYAVRSAEAPRGFAGPNDPWHAHEQLCLVGGIVTGDETVTSEECAQRGGTPTTLGRLWMTHAWVVPGWESAWGLFSNEHPRLGVTDER